MIHLLHAIYSKGELFGISDKKSSYNYYLMLHNVNHATCMTRII